MPTVLLIHTLTRMHACVHIDTHTHTHTYARTHTRTPDCGVAHTDKAIVNSEGESARVSLEFTVVTESALARAAQEKKSLEADLDAERKRLAEVRRELYLCIDVCMCVSMYVYVCICMSVCLSVCLSVYVYVCNVM